MAVASKTFRAELSRWPNGTYGLTVDLGDAPSQALDPVAVFTVDATSKAHVATAIIAHLVGHDTTHRVWRVR